MRLLGSLVLAVLLTVACLLLWKTPWDYASQDRDFPNAAASQRHFAGTDELGRDRGVRTAFALLIGLTGAIVASAIASCFAVTLAVAGSFAPRTVGPGLLYLGDLFLTLPWIFLLMTVRAALPLTLDCFTSAVVTFLLLAILGAPAYLRLHYTRARRLQSSEWMLQSRALGLRPRQIVRQLLPHLAPMMLTQFLLYVPACVAAEANLGTLGLGISEPLPSWGSMLQTLQNGLLFSNPWLLYLPVALLVLTLMLLELIAFGTDEVAP